MFSIFSLARSTPGVAYKFALACLSARALAHIATAESSARKLKRLASETTPTTSAAAAAAAARQTRLCSKLAFEQHTNVGLVVSYERASATHNAAATTHARSWRRAAAALALGLHESPELLQSGALRAPATNAAAVSNNDDEVLWQENTLASRDAPREETGDWKRRPKPARRNMAPVETVRPNCWRGPRLARPLAVAASGERGFCATTTTGARSTEAPVWMAAKYGLARDALVDLCRDRSPSAATV